MRLKHRFLICQLDFGSDSGAATTCLPADIFAAIRASMIEVFGDVGWGASASVLAVKYYSPVTRLVLVRSPSATLGQVRGAIALIKSVKKRPAALHVLQVAGSFRTLHGHLTHWQGVTTGALKASAAADAVELDPEFLAALDADLAEAMPGQGGGGGGGALTLAGSVSRKPAR